ncbi:AAA family ATPase [Vibrio alginolyticus]|nr:AAA family ATPase [Vibrio alginolyticus]
MFVRLLSLKLDGRYKGLKNQYFDFHCTQGNIVALIGLNGSGKSQLLELIAEAFAFLERTQRSDFKVKTPLGFGFELTYQLGGTTDHSAGSPGMEFGSPLAVAGGISNPRFKVTLDQTSKQPSAFVWLAGTWNEIRIEELELPFIVGYSSGQNENLQRSFMKNAVQYFEVQRIRLRRRKELSGKLEDFQHAEINRQYLDKYPHIFSPTEGEAFDQDGYLALREADTPISRAIYLDYDSAGLMLACLAVLPVDDVERLLSEVTFKHPTRITLQYDFRGGVAEEDAIRDIRMLMRIAGESSFNPIGREATSSQYDTYELEYLAGQITLDLTNQNVAADLRESNYGDPITLFRRLYKLQQLGVKNLQYASRLQLQKDNFLGTVKKPLKTKLPLSITELVLSDGNDRTVCLDDLSDGEAQLIEVLATARIFSPERTLFLFDEPETHLNPSWRTYFHSHLSKAMVLPGNGESQAQVFLSTHSPFMVSSLKKEDVLFFERDDEGLIKMEPVGSQTYGASFEVLIKNHFGLRSLISQTVVEAVKEYLPKDERPESLAAAREWIEENLGDSMEKAYLLRKLQS